MNYVYIVHNNQVLFLKSSNGKEAAYSPNPKDAKHFEGRWDSVPGQSLPRHVDVAKEYAAANGAFTCMGNPRDLLVLHEQGPRIGQRVRIKRTRSDGHVYGTGTVSGYVGILPHFLTHIVLLDNPPEAGVPDELGVFCTDETLLANFCCSKHEIELI